MIRTLSLFTNPDAIQERLLSTPGIRSQQDLSVYGQQKEAARYNQICMTVMDENTIEFSENFGIRGGVEVTLLCSHTKISKNQTEVVLRLVSGIIERKFAYVVLAISTLVALYLGLFYSQQSNSDWLIIALAITGISGFYLATNRLYASIFISKILIVLRQLEDQT